MLSRVIKSCDCEVNGNGLAVPQTELSICYQIMHLLIQPNLDLLQFSQLNWICIGLGGINPWNPFSTIIIVCVLSESLNYAKTPQNTV